MNEWYAFLSQYPPHCDWGDYELQQDLVVYTDKLIMTTWGFDGKMGFSAIPRNPEDFRVVTKQRGEEE